MKCFKPIINGNVHVAMTGQHKSGVTTVASVMAGVTPDENPLATTGAQEWCFQQGQQFISISNTLADYHLARAKIVFFLLSQIVIIFCYAILCLVNMKLLKILSNESIYIEYLYVYKIQLICVLLFIVFSLLQRFIFLF